ncbi:MAG: GIN domain-containing protein [Caulobacterales bacterium]
MMRQEFLAALRAGLHGMPPKTVDDIVADYDAHFVDGLAAGRTEAQVAEALGDPGKLARELRAAAGPGGWDEWQAPRAAASASASFFRSMSRHGPLGWLVIVLVALIVLSVLPTVISIVGALIGIVLTIALVVAIIAAILAAIFGGGWWWGGRWNGAFRSPVDGSGPWASRSFAWVGGDSLSISVPAEVDYAQGPNVALTISGPSGALDRIVVSNGDISYDRWVLNAGKLKITLTAPDVTRFVISGSVKLSLRDYRQDKLKIRIAGRGEVTGAGEARMVEVGVAGTGDVDLGQVKAEQVKVEIAGQGRAVIAPTQVADIGIAGAGTVTLLTNPPTVKSRMAGSGRIIHAAPGA